MAFLRLFAGILAGAAWAGTPAPPAHESPGLPAAEGPRAPALEADQAIPGARTARGPAGRGRPPADAAGVAADLGPSPARALGDVSSAGPAAPLTRGPQAAPLRLLGSGSSGGILHATLQGFLLTEHANDQYILRNGSAWEVNGQPTYWSFWGLVLYLCSGSAGARWYVASMNEGHWAEILQGACVGDIRGPAGATDLIPEGMGDWEEKHDCGTGAGSSGDVDTSDDGAGNETETTTTSTTTTTTDEACQPWRVTAGAGVSEVADGAPDEKVVEIVHLGGFSQAELNTAYTYEVGSEEQIAGQPVYWSVDRATFIAKCPDLNAWGVFATGDFDEVSSGECSTRLATSPPGELVDTERLLQDWSEHLFGTNVPRPGSGVQAIGWATSARFTTSSTTTTTTTTTTMADPFIVTSNANHEGAGVMNVVAAALATAGFMACGILSLRQGARRSLRKEPCGAEAEAGDVQCDVADLEQGATGVAPAVVAEETAGEDSLAAGVAATAPGGVDPAGNRAVGGARSQEVGHRGAARTPE